MATTADLISSANDLLARHANLLAHVRASQRASRSRLQAIPSPPTDLLSLPLIPSCSPSPPPSPPSEPLSPVSPRRTKSIRSDLPPAKRARATRYVNYVPEEETIRNDYSQRYVDGGEWPQNWVLGAEPERRFEEFPKQQRLLTLKKAAVAEHSLPATHLSLTQLPNLAPLRFDVILVDPPFSSTFTWENLEQLQIPSLAADPSFIFLWVGSGAGDGLERGREILARWGYRRCEDVTWVKTNAESNRGPGTDPPTTSLFTRTKQHCLIGIRGTVRRSTDNWFVHCNIDTDVIIWEGDPQNPARKPPEMYTLIENFCLGTRRIEIFGRIYSLRRGWVTVTEEELELTPEEAQESDNAVLFDKETWDGKIKDLAQGGKSVVPSSQEIDNLRPKSPVPRGGSAPTPSQTSASHPSRPPMSGMMNNMGPGNQNFNNQMMGPQMNMMGMGMNPMGNAGNMVWPMGNMAVGQGVTMSPQGNFGFGFDQGQQAMMAMGQGMEMGMGPQGFGFGFDVNQGNMAFGMGGPPGVWMGDFGGHGPGQQGQFMDPSMWGMGGMDMSQWGNGGYQ